MDRKIIIEDDTLYDLVNYIRNKTAFGAPRFSTWDAIRITITKIFREVYGAQWRTVTVSSVDPDQLFKEFKHGYKGHCSEQTYKLYQSRLNRAFSSYRLAKHRDEIQLYSSKESFNKALKQLSDSIEILHELYYDSYARNIFTREARNNYETHSMPISPDKIISIAIPKDLSPEELKKTNKIINGIIANKLIQKEVS